MVLLTSLCAIRVANVPEVCVGKNKKKKERKKKKIQIESSQMLSGRYAGEDVSGRRCWSGLSWGLTDL